MVLKSSKGEQGIIIGRDDGSVISKSEISEKGEISMLVIEAVNRRGPNMLPSGTPAKKGQI